MNDPNPDFDLFLSYNRLDRKLVEPLAEALRGQGLRVFKDDWYLRPGEPWPAALERNLAASRAVAVAVGRNGLGPWQQREAAAALDRQIQMAKVEQVLPVIPVLLDQGSDRQAGLAFLLQNTWVDAVRNGPLRVVLTLRVDYWGEVLNDEPLAARLPDPAILHLRALDRAALEMVVRRPAEITRLGVPDALVEVLLDDAAGQPGDLPLLEFTLQQLWAEGAGDGGSLTLDAFRAMGGLEKSIVTRAESVYASLEPAEREAVPGVFAALVQVGEARTDLRRRARLGELGAAGQAVARRLADERLLVTSRDWTNGDEPGGGGP